VYRNWTGEPSPCKPRRVARAQNHKCQVRYALGGNEMTDELKKAIENAHTDEEKKAVAEKFKDEIQALSDEELEEVAGGVPLNKNTSQGHDITIYGEAKQATTTVVDIFLG